MHYNLNARLFKDQYLDFSVERLVFGSPKQKVMEETKSYQERDLGHPSHHHHLGSRKSRIVWECLTLCFPKVIYPEKNFKTSSRKVRDSTVGIRLTALRLPETSS